MTPLSSTASAIAAFVAGAFVGRGVAALVRHLARQGGFASSRYYSLARGWTASLPIIGHVTAPRGSRCPRLALIELMCGGAALACWEMFPAGKAIAGALFLWALIGACFVDLDHMIIPDLFTIGLAVAGVAISFGCPALHDCGSFSAWHCLRSGAAGLLGLAIGSATVLWFGLIGEMLLGREVMGFGDVKFLGAIGAFCGWQGALFSLFAGAMLGGVALLTARLRAACGTGPRIQLFDSSGARGQQGSLGGSQPFPFGPMLAAAAAVYFLGGAHAADTIFAPYRALF